MQDTAVTTPCPVSESAFDFFAQQAKRHHLCTAAEEIHLATAIRAWLDASPDAPDYRRLERRGRRAKERLINANLRLVIVVANKQRSRLPACRGIGMEDLLQEGVIGLVRGVELFDPVRGYKASTYLYWWVAQGIGRAIENSRGMIRLPSGPQTIARRWKYRSPGQTLQAFCAQYGYREKMVQEALDGERASLSVSLSSPLPGAADISLEDALPDERSPDQLEALDWQEALQAVRDVAGDDLALLELHHLDGVTQTQLAPLIDTSRTGVARLVKQARESVLQALPVELQRQLASA